MKDLVKISRRLSKALRHDPASINVSLNENGWASTNLVCKGLNISIDELKQIVSDNDKQRFEFNNDDSMIRARQGHSVDVDLNLQATDPPAMLYHGTSKSIIPVILKTGLNKMKRHHVHLSESLQTAQKVGDRRKDETIILKINSAAMRAEGIKFYKTDNNVWLTDYVNPKFITQ